MTASGDALAVVGIFLTLIGLLGSFFFVHLGEWYRDVLALASAWDAWSKRSGLTEDAEKDKISSELARVALGSVVLSTGPVIVFIVVIVGLFVGLVATCGTSAPEWWYVVRAGMAFAIVFSITTVVLFWVGSVKLAGLRAEIRKWEERARKADSL